MKEIISDNENVEFYNTPSGQVMIHVEGEPVRLLKEEDVDFISRRLETIQSLFPDAFSALSELYSKNSRNKKWYEFRMVSRFIRCNFGEYDELRRDIQNGVYNFEEVKCPQRGECPFEGIICKPKMKTILTNAEKSVAKLYASGLTFREIADELGISYNTVHTELYHVKVRLKLKSSKEITKWIKNNNIE
jgi:DNA-binding CsgD family transcriptional regulator